MSMFGGALLHADGHGSHSAVRCFLEENLGLAGAFLDEVILHGLLDTLKIVIFLFITYLLMEFLEHKASDKVRSVMIRAGKFGPCVGGLFGAVPQCGFSAVASNLYTGRVITVGTLMAVFLSTSDEMLPILLAGDVNTVAVLLIVLYKAVVGIAVGFAVDFLLTRIGRTDRSINIDEICDNDNCHCERGILRSALHHTLTVSIFVFLVTVGINTLLFFVGEENLENIMINIPLVSHLLCALIGLIPNCASSVLLARCAMSGIISVGAMISGLLTGAGVGILVLFRMNRHMRENLTVTVLLLAVGVVFGFVADFIPIFAL